MMQIVPVLGMQNNMYQPYGSNNTGLFLQQQKKNCGFFMKQIFYDWDD